MKKSKEKIYATEREAKRIYKGLYESDFSDWYNLCGNKYASIGSRCGIEVKRTRAFFHADDIIYPVDTISFATLDEKEYFIQINKVDGNTIYIPIW